MLLMAVVLAAVTLTVRSLLLDAVTERITTALEQEANEFAQFAAGGVNPVNGRPFTSSEQVFQVHLARQVSSRDEVLMGVVRNAGQVRPVLDPQPAERTNRYTAAAAPSVLSDIISGRSTSGTVGTAEGQMRWVKVAVEGDDAWFVVGYFTAGERAAATETVRSLVLVSLVGLLLAGGAGWLVAGEILAPVRLVRQAAAEIGERDLRQRIPVRGSDDISALAEQFNAMLDRLEAAFGAQRQFVDDASHELRTPITIIRGHLELMGEDPAERAAVVRIVLDELDRMGRIVEDLLLLAKSDRPDFVRPEPVSVAELTSDIDAKVRALGDRCWRLEAIGEGTVLVDPQRVTQAMAQLAQNAVQHTQDGDEIRIGSAVAERVVSFWVTDTGPGVSPLDAQKIFQRFSRGSRTTRGHHAGAGLGLAIVRAIADGHHGSVRLVSQPGHGATFGVELPVVPPARPLTKES
jgi:two-component system, OmpR family, sensor kinase